MDVLAPGQRVCNKPVHGARSRCPPIRVLILLDVVQGRIRASLIAWLAMVTVAYSEGGLGFIMWRRQWWGVDASIGFRPS